MKFNIIILAALLNIISCGNNTLLKTDKDSLKLVFKDDFERKELGSNWYDTSKKKCYKIVNGRLRVTGAYNHPLWLKKKLPVNGVIEFTAHPMSQAIDIKAEFYGDGKSKAIQASYNATSYVVILGGWNNSKSIIARMDEHGQNVKTRKKPAGTVGKTYQFKIERKTNNFTWFLDGNMFLKMNDNNPLTGNGHEYFAFNNWQSEVFFDSLTIYSF